MNFIRLVWFTSFERVKHLQGTKEQKLIVVKETEEKLNEKYKGYIYKSFDNKYLGLIYEVLDTSNSVMINIEEDNLIRKIKMNIFIST